MLTRRSMVIAGYYAAALFGSFAIWASLAIPVLRHARLVAQPSTAWLLTGAYAAAMAWAAWFLWRYWRRLDEAAREAQKFAWFVGSIAAIVLTAPVMMFFRARCRYQPACRPASILGSATCCSRSASSSAS